MAEIKQREEEVHVHEGDLNLLHLLVISFQAALLEQQQALLDLQRIDLEKAVHYAEYKCLRYM